MKKHFFTTICLLAFLIFACKKQNENPQWDVNVLGPLAHATLGINNLIGDSFITANNSGALSIRIDTSFSNLKLDSVYQVPDTTILTSQVFPAFPTTITPGTTFISGNNNVTLGVSNVQLKFANISTGFIKLDFKNTLQSKIILTYTIPKAKKNGIPFTITANVDSGSVSNPAFFSQLYDFTGYSIDMTGSTGGLFNTISYDVEAKSDPNGYTFNLFGSDTLINLKTSLLQITPNYVRGYLGQNNLNDTKEINLGIGGLIRSGTVLLDSINMQFDISNYIGADIQAYVDHLISVNNRTATNILLSNSTLIQHPININRAIDPYFASYNPTPTLYSIVLNKNNSNIKQLIENLPDKLRYDLKLKLNPLGNISGSSDFIYSNQLVKTRIQIDMPLSFAVNQLAISSTVDFSIASSANVDPIGPSTLYVVAKNGFPFDINLQLFLIDENNTVTDSILVPSLILSGAVGANLLVSQSTTTEIPIPIDAIRKSKILNTKRIGIRATFNSPTYPQVTQLYNSYHLDLKLIGDGTYYIR